MKTVVVCGFTPLGIVGSTMKACLCCGGVVWMTPRMQALTAGEPVNVMCVTCAKQAMRRADA